MSVQGRNVRFAPWSLLDSLSVRLQRLYKNAFIKAAVRTVLVPPPTATGRRASPPLRNRALLGWASDLLTAVAGEAVAA